jgi:D-glycero-D-manno-heptose 1,7-bisphosphate phosphatase
MYPEKDWSHMKAVIMAGGKGTRIASVNSQLPKPMLLVAGKPVLEHQIACLKRQKITEIILVIGHLGDEIKKYFGDGSNNSKVTGRPFGVHISYIEEKEPLGTGGALYLLKDTLKEDFLLINGDIIFDVNLEKFFFYHKKRNALATLFTHPNNHPYDSGLIQSDSEGRVIGWFHKEERRLWYRNQVNSGLHVLSPKILEPLHHLEKLDLDRNLLRPLIPSGKLYAYFSSEYVKDMGTPDRLHEVEKDILSGKVAARNLSCKQKAVFLDRDGTINKYVGFLTNIDDFKLLPGVAEAIRLINQSGYLAIVATNQPVIARGEITEEQLCEIHRKMETLLGREGAYLNDIFVCPHHPDKGFAGERPEYKVVCNCRKPKPGMLLDAAKKYNIDLKHSFMVGDSESDMGAGSSAGCHVAYIGDSDRYPSYKNLLAFAETLTSYTGNKCGKGIKIGYGT